ncbi:hypothetical protein B0H15DRAFT_834089 [Mycena belliarum]|uniref:Uncharacterized protein n=1 Tax=Mycena belliarum TaxID=1033014 RepID=A0AAD6U6C6_9AGAR|nr:hypothetical protein B0H15DRAFT_834089 [Mycena belliae]
MFSFPMATDLVSLRRGNHITLYVGSDNDWEGRLFCFERGSHSLVVQTPELKLPGCTHLNAPDFTSDEYRLYLSTFRFDLEKLSTMIESFVFGQENWAYLVARKDGSYRLQYREKVIRPISCPAWAPLIPETEMIYTKYINAEDREALWNGRVVDCFVGWNDRWRGLVDYAMRGHRLLDGLDLTYQVLGHIVRNGEIIGLMTEHAIDDRRVEYRDRAAVYAAITKVQSRGLIISLHESSINIHHGKVRLLCTQSVRKFSDVEDPEDAVSKFHWQDLSRIFRELREHVNPIPVLRIVQTDAVPFMRTPAPEKLLTTDSLFRIIAHITLALHNQEARDRDDVSTSRKAGPRRSGDKHGGLTLRPSRLLNHKLSHPYTPRRPLLTASDS